MRAASKEGNRSDETSRWDPQALTRWDLWPVSIIAFFAVAIIGFIAFIWFCSRHPDELVAKDYYEQELRYQDRIDRMQNARADAATATITYDSASKTILISLPRNSPGAISGVVHLYRPSAINQDRQFKLQTDAAGRQRIEAANLSPGLWKVRVSWTMGKQGYFIDRKVVIGDTAARDEEGTSPGNLAGGVRSPQRPELTSAR